MRSTGSKANTKHAQNRIIPGFHLTLGVSVAMLLLFILIPLGSVLVTSLRMSPADFWSVITEENVLSAFRTSLLFSFLAALINTAAGLVIAWVLVRYDFPGKKILDAMIELPLALPTAVAGITLSKMYSTTGEIGGPLSKLGILISYTRMGILVALIFIGIPFVVRSVQPVLKKINPEYEEAAFTAGASSFTIFFRVILPELLPALLTGFGLAFARGIGEYGSVVYISGNSAKNHTQVVSYVIMQKLNYLDYESATAIAFVMLVISFILLLAISFIQIRQAKRTSGSYEIASSKHVNRPKSRSRRFVLILFCALFVLLMLILPLLSVARNALSMGLSFYFEALSTEYVIAAFKITLLTTVIVLIVNTFGGVMISWALTRFRFKGKQVLSALIDIPFSISPVIAGLAYIMTFGRMGWAKPALDAINETFGTDIKLVFSVPGVILATIFVTFPFISRELIPVLNTIGTDEEETAAMMGARGFTIFRRVTFPHIKWPLVYGVILCAARAIGEFGAVNALSKTRGETFTLPLEIDALYMSGDSHSIVSAFAVSSVLALVAMLLIFVRSFFEYRQNRNAGGTK